MTWRPRRVLDALRRRLLDAQSGICPICGACLFAVGQGAWALTLEHVLPLSRDGRDAAGNLLVAHAECNHRRGNDLPTGCMIIWLLSVNAQLGVQPDRWAA